MSVGRNDLLQNRSSRNPSSSFCILCVTRWKGKRGIERTLAAKTIPVSIVHILLSIFNHMKILRVVGFGLALVTLRFLLPRVFHGFEDTLVSFFDVIQDSLALSSKAISNINLPK